MTDQFFTSVVAFIDLGLKVIKGLGIQMPLYAFCDNQSVTASYTFYF